MKYDLNERIVGTYIDNKPLYERCILSGTLPSTEFVVVAANTSAFEHKIENVDTMIPYEAILISPTNSDNFNNVNINVNSCIGVLSGNTKYLYIGTPVEYPAGYKILFRIRYTKTTD